MALAPLVAALPQAARGKFRASWPGHQDYTGLVLKSQDYVLYDAAVTEPTRVPRLVIALDQGDKGVQTATRDVLLLPTRLAPNTFGYGSGSANQPVSYTTTLPSVVPTTASVPQIQWPTSGTASSQSSWHPVAMAATVIATSAPHGPTQTLDATSSAPQLFGISYAPYRADGQCKTIQDIKADFEQLAGLYRLVRIYGTACDQVANVCSIARAHGIKVFLGIWNPNKVKQEAQQIISGVDNNWHLIDTVSVGNELVNNKEMEPKQLLLAVDQARSMLRKAGYDGPVVTVDTFTQVLQHPELCERSDYCAINAHAFYDKQITAEQSGRWLQDRVKDVSLVLKTPKRIVVAETGWPTSGEANGLAVPGLEAQRSAIESIKSAFANEAANVILFSAFNDLWKSDSLDTFNAEKSWGIGGTMAPSDKKLASF
ncbi:hypothetical protein CDD81_4581 [Ophiocordyceps australis]|uniref:Uncharacterized protein n=1 Tax=Ophiocordyceps australis TaxID=1399860 RepID=A0A2C5X705_9HYPO|nr:hypothetical protein CDD81_4581 [Ophiocordyceps australis]